MFWRWHAPAASDAALPRFTRRSDPAGCADADRGRGDEARRSALSVQAPGPAPAWLSSATMVEVRGQRTTRRHGQAASPVCCQPQHTLLASPWRRLGVCRSASSSALAVTAHTVVDQRPVFRHMVPDKSTSADRARRQIRVQRPHSVALSQHLLRGGGRVSPSSSRPPSPLRASPFSPHSLLCQVVFPADSHSFPNNSKSPIPRLHDATTLSMSARRTAEVTPAHRVSRRVRMITSTTRLSATVSCFLISQYCLHAPQPGVLLALEVRCSRLRLAFATVRPRSFPMHLHC